MKEKIRDRKGKIVASTETAGGVTVLRDFAGNVLGHYNSETDTTRAFYGVVVGKGNKLMPLLDELSKRKGRK